MRTICSLLGLSLLLLLGCTAADNASSTATTSVDTEATLDAEATRNISITGSGVQLVKLKMPGMT